MNAPKKPRIGITIGDINGIGMEVIMKALSENRFNTLCTPIIFGSAKWLAKYKKTFGYDFAYHQFNYWQENSVNPHKINVFNCCADKNVDIEFGKVTPQGGKAALESLQAAVQALQAKRIEALVTAPINKSNIQSDKFKFAGHTEFFTQKFNTAESLMFLVSETLRVGVLTGHIPLAEVPKCVNREKIIQKVEIMVHSLRYDFGIEKPKIAILGLNPHAGEEGLLGREELEIINPTIEELRQKGLLIYGSYPADGFFGKQLHKKFDGILGMYHDQGLIPFKTLAFHNGVNFTAGLPIIRTSPDHGTAYDIAGKNIASEESMVASILLALEVYRNRQKGEDLETLKKEKKQRDLQRKHRPDSTYLEE
ncbi:4-hydroxythreonine-4-phosphate dehydrogenase PdxA [Hugenholtzia roseola]|uniref:4-hydroxythreonine-4-phosphate dehydrogenase PdxA n=1 Tax=Hugenholtzia roseola TaxID=1002 RepID=UPI00068760A2|nr:4-hydroxythreonine-4-phosphate dehydrogenase PdxA [Hugenholtzia roseola]